MSAEPLPFTEEELAEFRADPTFILFTSRDQIVIPERLLATIDQLRAERDEALTHYSAAIGSVNRLVDGVMASPGFFGAQPLTQPEMIDVLKRQLDLAIEGLREARKELDKWGFGDMHYGTMPRSPSVLAGLDKIDRTLAKIEGES